MPDLQSTFARVFLSPRLLQCPISQLWPLHVVEGEVARVGVVVAVQIMEDVLVALTIGGQVIGSTDAGI